MDIKSDSLLLVEIGLASAKLDHPPIGLDVIFDKYKKRAHGVEILNSGAMHILDFWVRVIPHRSGAAILNSGVPMALNLRYIA